MKQVMGKTQSFFSLKNVVVVTHQSVLVNTLLKLNHQGMAVTRRSSRLKRQSAIGKRNALGDISNHNYSSNRVTTRRKNSSFKKGSRVSTRRRQSMNCDTSIDQSTNSKAIHFTRCPRVCDVDNLLHRTTYAREYVYDIYENWKMTENKYFPCPRYMRGQLLINEDMRADLLEWLIKFHSTLDLLPETLFLTVSIIDQFLARNEVSQCVLQWIGLASLQIATKYEEMFTLNEEDLEDCCRQNDLSSFTCPGSNIMKHLCFYEAQILQTIEYRLTLPSSFTFLHRFCKIAASTAQTEHFSMYLIERSLQEYEILVFKPSMVAATVLMIVQDVTEKKGWTRELSKHSGYRKKDLQECALTLKRVFRVSDLDRPHLQAVRNKYRNSEYFSDMMLNLY